MKVNKVIERYESETEDGEITLDLWDGIYYAEIRSPEPGHVFEVKFLETHKTLESAREALQKNLKTPYRTIGG